MPFPRRNRRGGNRTLDRVLIRDLLSPLSYAPVGPKGLGPLPPGLKGRYAAVTPRPQMQVGRICFHRACFMLLASSGSPESRTQRHPVISREWATGPRLPFARCRCSSGRDGRTRTCVSVLPKHVGSPLPYIPLPFPVRTGGFEPPISWSPTRRDTGLRYVLLLVTRTGVEPVLPP